MGVPQVQGKYSDVDATTAVIEEIDRRAPGAARMIPGDLSVGDLIVEYGQAAITVSHHLHACVLSLIAGTPAIAISTDGAKIEGLYESLGLPREWVVTADTSSEVVIDTAINAIGRRELVSRVVAEARGRLEDLPAVLLAFHGSLKRHQYRGANGRA